VGDSLAVGLVQRIGNFGGVLQRLCGR
jgi:hypothetical protein